MVKELKEKMMLVSERNNLNSQNVFMPFNESLVKSFPADQASDMTTAHRLYNYCTLLSLVNIDKRPRLLTRSKGVPVLKTCPFATFEDLQESVYLMEYSNGVRPYILEWYNEVFLVEFNEKKKNNNCRDDSSEESIGVTTRELVDATFRIKGRKSSTQQIYENYIIPLVNAGHVDKIDSRLDKRSYVFFPVLNTKQKKLFGLDETNNFSQNKLICVADSSFFPDKEYLISKIHGVLRYSLEKHVITKLEDHEGKEITAEELVDRYYKDPDRYFELDYSKNKPHPPPEDGGSATTKAVDITKASIEADNPSTSDDKNNIAKEEVRYEYSCDDKINSESQQIQKDHIKDIENQHNISKKLFGQAETNNFVILEKQRGLSFKCFYCNHFCSSDIERITHTDNEHPGRLYYPNPEDFENRLKR